MKVIILHNEIQTDNPDELDVLDQRDLVMEACKKLNHQVSCFTVGDDILEDIQKIEVEKPDIVFNLVESWWGKGELIYVVPALLNSLKIKFTGIPLDALFTTTSKVLAKKIMELNELPTAAFYSIEEISKLNSFKTYIAKPIWEEASVGITSEYIFKTSEKEKISKIKKLSNNHYFIEEFIDGHEFNVSLLATENGAEVLPIAEIVFSEYFKDKPKIVGYDAKWNENSEEYKQTNRVFKTLESNLILEKKIIDVCLKCWSAFNLKGYARVDLRVNNNDEIFILEINGNPCIAPDSGFIAALQQKGYSNEEMVLRILADSN